MARTQALDSTTSMHPIFLFLGSPPKGAQQHSRRSHHLKPPTPPAAPRPETLVHSTCRFRWVKVPSHVDIAENEKADRLAEQGRKMSPLYNTVHRAVRHPVTPPCSPPSTENMR